MIRFRRGQYDRWRADCLCDEERAQDLAEFIEARARSVDEIRVRDA